MAGSLNKVMLIGNLGADPEVCNTPTGTQVANFHIACTENRKDASGQPTGAHRMGHHCHLEGSG